MRPAGAVSFTFIKKQHDRAGHLEQLLAREFPRNRLPRGWDYSVEEGEFDPVLNAAITQIEASGSTLAATFALLDPFGYSGFQWLATGRLT